MDLHDIVPILNWKRRSTQGFGIDFPTLNVLGFVCYSVSTCFFLYSPTIREQYAARHPLAPEPTVRFNDAAFGIHAVLMVLLTYSQFFSSLWGFKGSGRARTSRPVLGIFWGSLFAVAAVAGFVYRQSGAYGQSPRDWAWIDVLYTLGYVKLVCTFVKYIPQAWMNYQRKSTQGWSIDQILFDMVGGILSLLQLLIDASFQGDWSGITGNSLKFGLSNISIAFDLIFITQHYILYRDQLDESIEATEEETGRPLLGS
ncbi:uncharacterized protein A1O9_08632 [Exophiala aquamarina CBS 119918]|uniref:Cystinosin n=1 Tax=Exophiala aquamarina CBS 119918 TaxID=1182545 RepID=A0A072PHG2_9EURO|nr:uncharacterized protein A1O9_08632 [Exophiala aquamarina CBS 119918]KEF54980.1 hypothetical protein A1O9_08632 [Exophiala aquamarina CBS 119918]